MPDEVVIAQSCVQTSVAMDIHEINKKEAKLEIKAVTGPCAGFKESVKNLD